MQITRPAHPEALHFGVAHFRLAPKGRTNSPGATRTGRGVKRFHHALKGRITTAEP